MRKFMNIVESVGITVYHGGSGPVAGELVVPFFATPHLEMARSYARIKGRGDGRVTAFQLSPTAKVAHYHDVEEVAEDMAVDWEGSHISDLFYIGGDYHADYDVAGELREKGFDAVLINDFGYHDDFAEEPTYIVLNPAVLSQPEEIERVESR